MPELLRHRFAAAFAAIVISLLAVVLAPTSAYARSVTNSHVAAPNDSGVHTNGNVSISVFSLNGSGPDITNVQIFTANEQVLPTSTAVYLEYGATPDDAKQRTPLMVDVTAPGGFGYSFGVFRTLNVGWVLCGQIQGVSGYPCVTIGA